MARGRADGEAGDDARLGSAGSPLNRAAGYSTKGRLLKVGLHPSGKSVEDRREGEDALAAWKKYKGA
jgi:hypothetical protein